MKTGLFVGEGILPSLNTVDIEVQGRVKTLPYEKRR